ncbi:MAG: 2'-5' RNA ligase family protein [Flavobacteriales bacterium]|nr:2'-5' RNA ligase family protein [Flavobacteriales bacterium]
MGTDPNGKLFDVPVLGYRYLLVIRPSKEITAVVNVLKEKVEEAIGPYRYRHSTAHITLFYADLPVECERDLCEGIARGVEGHGAFRLHYEGITHFENKQTIYIDPVEKQPIDSVRKSVVAYARSYKRLKKLGINPSDHPHLTIAAGLKPAQFERAWESLAPHELRAEEQVTEVVLLRRAMREGERYAHVRSFVLE